MNARNRADGARSIGRRMAVAGWILLAASALRPDAARAQSPLRPGAASAVPTDARTTAEPSPGLGERLRNEPWEFSVAPYLWLSTVQGATSIGDLSSFVDVDYGDLFSLLGKGDLFAAMGYFAAQKGPIGAFVDFSGSMVKTRTEFRDRAPVKIWNDSLFLEFALYLQLLDIGPPSGPGHVTASLQGGFRWNHVWSKLSTYRERPDSVLARSATQNWVDPVVGGGFTLDVTEDTSLFFRGDIGGFGAGSQLAWELVGVFDIYLGMMGSARTDLLIGYKVYDFDYETDTRRDRKIRLQETLAGPLLGIAWKF